MNLFRKWHFNTELNLYFIQIDSRIYIKLLKNGFVSLHIRNRVCRRFFFKKDCFQIETSVNIVWQAVPSIRKIKGLNRIDLLLYSKFERIFLNLFVYFYSLIIYRNWFVANCYLVFALLFSCSVIYISIFPHFWFNFVGAQYFRRRHKQAETSTRTKTDYLVVSRQKRKNKWKQWHERK